MRIFCHKTGLSYYKLDCERRSEARAGILSMSLVKNEPEGLRHDHLISLHWAELLSGVEFRSWKYTISLRFHTISSAFSSG